MSYKTSYSQNNTYIKCPKHWYWNYVEKLESPAKGASLYFGSAVDEAVMSMLQGKTDYMDDFYDRWRKAYAFGVSTPVFDNPDVVYGYADFDKDLLEQKDIDQLNQWIDDIGIRDRKKLGLKKATKKTPAEDENNPFDVYNAIVRLKKNPYKAPTDDQLKWFSRASWLSMKKKGEILIESFKDQFYPKIKKVIATQARATIEDPLTKDKITGFIDMVLEIEGYDKPIIFDLKTAARPYTQDQIDLTEQLTLYAGMKSHEYNTNLVGYVVLPKNINKKVVAKCKTCGHIRHSTHKTCDAKVNGVRCGGDWDETKTLEPQVQVLIEEKSPEQIEALFIDIGNIILAMKNKVVYKNTSACTNWYGNTCPYYNACHKGDLKGLVKRSYGGKKNGTGSNESQS